MFHAIWVWAGILEGEKLPLMVESFVRLLGDTNTDWTLVLHTTDDALLYWASLPATYHEGLIKMMPLVLKLGVHKHLMIDLAAGGLIAESTAREVALAICEQTEQSETLTLNDYVVAYNDMQAKHKPESLWPAQRCTCPSRHRQPGHMMGLLLKHGTQSART